MVSNERTGEHCIGRRAALRAGAALATGILPCARERGHDYCFECDELPCEELEAFTSDGYEHHRLTVENMKRMK